MLGSSVVISISHARDASQLGCHVLAGPEGERGAAIVPEIVMKPPLAENFVVGTTSEWQATFIRRSVPAGDCFQGLAAYGPQRSSITRNRE
jgi:hypothetical protein